MPVVLKVHLKLLGHLLWKGLVAVEMGEQAEPLGQVLRVLVVCGDSLEAHQDVNELGHDVGEAGDSDQEDDGGEDTLDLTLGGVVSETDCGECGEDEVDDYDEVLLFF